MLSQVNATTSALHMASHNTYDNIHGDELKSPATQVSCRRLWDPGGSRQDARPKFENLDSYALGHQLVKPFLPHPLELVEVKCAGNDLAGVSPTWEAYGRHDRCTSPPLRRPTRRRNGSWYRFSEGHSLRTRPAWSKRISLGRFLGSVLSARSEPTSESASPFVGFFSTLSGFSGAYG